MSLQALQTNKFFSTKGTGPQSSQGCEQQYTVQSVRHETKKSISPTNCKRNAYNVYSNDTIIYVDKHVEDNSVKDAEMTTARARSVSNNVTERTTANSACNKRGKKVRRGGRNTRHVEDKHASHLKIFSTNAASIINGKLESSALSQGSQFFF